MQKLVNGELVDLTSAEIAEREEESARKLAEYEANKYAELRRFEYPPIEDQLDALWKGGQAQADMKAVIDNVKAKYPKP